MAASTPTGTIDSNGKITLAPGFFGLMDQAFLDGLTRIPDPDEKV